MIPKINVLMMAYNNAKFIEIALRSVREVANKVVVVEGGWNPKRQYKSTDGTLEILERLSQENIIDDLINIWLYNWYNKPEKYFELYQVSDKQKEWIAAALSHPFYDGKSLQNQLIARDFGLKTIMSYYDDNEDPGWLFIVDSDEIYERNALDNLVDFLSICGEDYDFFTIQGMNFYFDAQYYTTEWYRRLFKIKTDCFFSDDNSLETPEEPYRKTMNLPSELVSFYHYNYYGRDLNSKLAMWQEKDVQEWFQKHEDLLTGKEYDGRTVHLFEKRNLGYSDYKLHKFEGSHPGGVVL